MNRSMVPVFPRPTSQDPTGKYPAQDGATLREYLTGQALIAVMALNAGGNPDYQLMADHAVAMADLTLIALDRVTHEDNAARILRSSADPFARDQERENLPEDEKEPAKTDEETSKDPSATKKPADAAAKTDAKKTGKAKT